MAENDNVRFRYTRHAEERRVQYRLRTDEVEQIVLRPEWSEFLKESEDVVRVFGRPTSQADRYYRVLDRFESEEMIVIISVHPDRDARPPEATP